MAWIILLEDFYVLFRLHCLSCLFECSSCCCLPGKRCSVISSTTIPICWLPENLTLPDICARDILLLSLLCCLCVFESVRVCFHQMYEVQYFMRPRLCVFDFCVLQSWRGSVLAARVVCLFVGRVHWPSPAPIGGGGTECCVVVVWSAPSLCWPEGALPHQSY